MPTPEHARPRKRPAAASSRSRVGQPPDFRACSALLRTTLARQERLSELLERLARATVAITTKAVLAGNPGDALTLQQWRALLLVGDRPDGMTVSEVGARVGVTVPATSRLLKRLAVRGYMTITQDETDHRAMRMRLTAGGSELREEILRRRRQSIQDAVSTIRASSSTLSELGLVADAFDAHQ